MADDILPHQPVHVVIPASGPSIESERIILRPVADRDTAALFAVRASPEVAKTNYPKEPFKSLEQTKEWLSSKIFNVGPDDVIGRSFNYAIVEKSISDPEEQVIGYVSVNALVPSPEIGYSLLPKFWNKGYATEALNLLLKMWWDLPRRSSSDLIGSIEDVERIYAICEKDNPGSCKVLKKCGFEIVKEIRFGTDELYLWALERQ